MLIIIRQAPFNIIIIIGLLQLRFRLQMFLQIIITPTTSDHMIIITILFTNIIEKSECFIRILFRLDPTIEKILYLSALLHLLTTVIRVIIIIRINIIIALRLF